MAKDPTFAEDIERAAGGEEILAIVLGARGYKDDTTPNLGVPVKWEEARPILDYEYDSGYGGVDCHAIMAWTETWVLFVCSYDGSTWVASVPRKPQFITPDTYGGG